MEQLSQNNSKIYITSDTHFGHKNILQYCNRPFDSVEKMNELMVFYWNEIVGQNDTVIHCGDFSLGNKELFSKILSHLNGKIFIIRGNHDGNKEFFRQFEDKITILPYAYQIEVLGKKNIKGISFSHCPMPLKEIPKGYVNFHGHIHSTPQDNKNNFFPHMDIGVDMYNYQPMSIKALVDLAENIAEKKSNNE